MFFVWRSYHEKPFCRTLPRADACLPVPYRLRSRAGGSEPDTDSTQSNLPQGEDSVALAVPEYPSFLSFEDHEGEMARREELPKELLAAINGFAAATSSKLLRAEYENSLYSPLSLYLALSMLSESAGGETREQILSLLSTLIRDTSSADNSIFAGTRSTPSS